MSPCVDPLRGAVELGVSPFDGAVPLCDGLSTAAPEPLLEPPDCCDQPVLAYRASAPLKTTLETTTNFPFIDSLLL
jgi:hypothetical protein